MGAMTDAPAVLLLVDDDEAKRYVIATWLRRAGHTVIEVATGREALDQVDTAELVLLDVNLPDISGYEVCRQIKGDPRTAAIPVIQVSATAVGASDKAQGGAALLPGPPAGRADRCPADRADQRDARHQRGKYL
jgi:CheY-like chemotaxis protein